MRYDALYSLVWQLKPEVILETGTWRGRSAQKMLEASPNSFYYGFDVWEEATPEFNLLEANGKKPSTMDMAEQVLKPYRHELIKGNTRWTLPKFVNRGILIDFAFIDGGHSVATIESDWNNIRMMLKPNAVVVFDDYFVSGMDTEKFGCNNVVKDIKYRFLAQDELTYEGNPLEIAMVIYEHS